MSKKNKQIDLNLIEKVENALSNTVNAQQTNVDASNEDSGNLLSKPEITAVHNNKSEETRDESKDELIKQLDEINERFLDVSGKMHFFESENIRLQEEKNILEKKYSDMEKWAKTLENDLFKSNMEIAEKISRITSLESAIESLKKNPVKNGFGNNTKIGMNGYESWN